MLVVLYGWPYPFHWGSARGRLWDQTALVWKSYRAAYLLEEKCGTVKRKTRAYTAEAKEEEIYQTHTLLRSKYCNLHLCDGLGSSSWLWKWTIVTKTRRKPALELSLQCSVIEYNDKLEENTHIHWNRQQLKQVRDMRKRGLKTQWIESSSSVRVQDSTGGSCEQCTKGTRSRRWECIGNLH